jgi:hypothetical protein
MQEKISRNGREYESRERRELIKNVVSSIASKQRIQIDELQKRGKQTTRMKERREELSDDA